MEQSQGDHPLKIDITRTTEVSTVLGITEDMTPTSICAVSSSRVLLPPPGLRGDQYTLIRLSGVEDENVLEKLDTKIGTVNEVPNIEKLNDGSWEICILKSHRRTVKDTLRRIFPGSNVDLYYDPLEPTANDSEIWGYDKAKTLCKEWFFERAIRVAKEAWPAGAACYTYCLKVMSGLAADFTLMPTYQGYLQSKEDAVYLLEACLSGKLVHSFRGPQDGEATISGNIFVWETNITGIDGWRDGMEWAIWEEDGFEIGEAIDGSELMKKTISISTRGRTHHVVSYYTACDAQTLARPSKELDLGPFSNLVPSFDAQPQHHFHKEMVLPQRQGSPKNTLCACTFSKCFEKFGSKSAWKLHENSRHFQQECWLCPFCPCSHSNQTSMYESEDGNRQVQIRLFCYRCAYITHLQSVHSVDDDIVNQQIREQRIGRNCQSRYWCGFCGKIVPLQKKGLEGANERFDHIGGHFGGGEQIANYIEMDGSGVKGKNERGESDECHISIASSEDGHVATMESTRQGMTREESVADADEWDGDFDSTPLLERPYS
jgi:Gti1/Pac2 family